MNAHVLRRLGEALAPKLLGARLEKIHALSAEVSQWSFYGQGEKFYLLFKAQRQHPFLFITPRRVPVGAEPPNVIMRLRKYLAGQRVQAVFIHWIARRIWLRFSAEAQIWLCLDLREGPSLHWDPPADIDPAALLCGEAPAAPDNAAVYWPTPHDLAAALPDAWRTWPVLSPDLRRTLVLLPPEEQAALLADLESGGGDLFVYDTPDEPSPPLLSAWPLPEALRASRCETVYEDPLAAAAAVGEQLVLRNLALDTAQRAAKPHLRETARLERLLIKLDEEAGRLQALAALRDDALALQAVLYRFDPALKQAGVDVDEPSGPRHIALDPKMTVRENMAALFHRSGRGRRGLALLEERRAAVRARLAEVRTQALMAEGLAPACHTALPPQAKSKDGRGKAAKPAPAFAGVLPKGVQAFRSSDGLLMLRGKDARGNLAALKLGRPDDLWLHAEGAAGAHVILQRPPGREIPERSLREAAVLAGLKSPYRDAGTARIQCAQVRHVHPMRGAAPGTVRIDRHEAGLTVHLEPELEMQLSTV